MRPTTTVMSQRYYRVCDTVIKIMNIEGQQCDGLSVNIIGYEFEGKCSSIKYSEFLVTVGFQQRDIIIINKQHLSQCMIESVGKLERAGDLTVDLISIEKLRL